MGTTKKENRSKKQLWKSRNDAAHRKLLVLLRRFNLDPDWHIFSIPKRVK